MNYHQLAELFKGTTTGAGRLLKTRTSTIILQWIDFQSDIDRIPDLTSSGYSFEPSDSRIAENFRFQIPIIRTTDSFQSEKAVILLHGLNERSWIKYWSWAASLAEKLGRPVILFPISFHMNRAPASWSNARTIHDIMNHNPKDSLATSSTTFVNYMLSKRLITNPIRFISSGIQSVLDFQKLIQQADKQKIIELKGIRTFDVFAYSIGGFLTQIMLINNFLTSAKSWRTFLFCGGAPFEAMNGISKFIMNKEAFSNIFQFYMNQTEREIKMLTPLGRFLLHDSLGQSFRAMTSPQRNPTLLKSAFSALGERLGVITLQKDAVIPAASTIKLFAGSGVQVAATDFDYPYTHENPFPLTGDQPIREKVNIAFNFILKKAYETLKY